MARGISECTECVEAFDHVWHVCWSRNPLDPRNLLLAPRQVRKIVAQEEYDLVHVHTPVAAFVTRYALRGLRQREKPKIIYTAHGFHFYQGGPRFRNALFSYIEKLAGRWTDYLVTINHEDEMSAVSHHIVPPNRLCYIPGIGVDTRHYRPEAVSRAEVERVRNEIGLDSEDKLFLMVAAFNPGKRHRDAIEAFAQLHYPKTHLAFAGIGPLMGKMESLAAELGVQPRVHFLRYRRDVPALMRASTAVLLPSEREGLSRSVMESQSLQVPVIGADSRGIRDLLKDGCGVLVKVGDVRGLTKAMAWMIDNPNKAQMMARRGRERICTYDLDRILVLYEALYRKALSDECVRGEPEQQHCLTDIREGTE